MALLPEDIEQIGSLISTAINDFSTTLQTQQENQANPIPYQSQLPNDVKPEIQNGLQSQPGMTVEFLQEQLKQSQELNRLLATGFTQQPKTQTTEEVLKEAFGH